MTNMNDDRAKLETMLVELGVTSTKQVSNGVQIVFDDIYTTIMIYGDSTLSLLCSVKRDDGGWDLRQINAANNRVRFAKFSLERGNLLLDADFVFQLRSFDSLDKLRQILALWRMALRELQVLVEEMIPA